MDDEKMVAETLPLNDEDIIIAVMGITGSGKSTFISKLVDQGVAVGHSLESCTSDVEMFQFSHPCGRRVFLLDTPGFDDTNKSDTEVLKLVAGYLSNMYEKKIQLSGIIYLHRITDVRLSGSALKNLNMFKKLCGESFYKNVILATTMWGNLTGANSSHETGVQRERELTGNKHWWGMMSSRGSRVMRYELCDRQSALDIVQYLINNSEAAVLQVQTELVDEHKSLLETSAGQEVNKDLQEASKKWSAEIQDMRSSYTQAIQDKDHELAAMLEEQSRIMQQQMRQAQREQQELRMSLQQLLRDNEAKNAQQLRHMQAQMDQRDAALQESHRRIAEMASERQQEQLRERQRASERDLQLEQERRRHAAHIEEARVRHEQSHRQQMAQMDAHGQQWQQTLASERDKWQTEAASLRGQLSQAISRSSGNSSPIAWSPSLSPSPSPSPPRRSSSPIASYSPIANESVGGRDGTGPNMAAPLAMALAGAAFGPLGIVAGGLMGLVMSQR